MSEPLIEIMQCDKCNTVYEVQEDSNGSFLVRADDHMFHEAAVRPFCTDPECGGWLSVHPIEPYEPRANGNPVRHDLAH